VTTEKAYLRPRPVRVAYLVEDGEYWAEVLDAIAARSLSFWGGRFSLIVPCSKDGIDPAYAPWLRAYDPDIVYSYVDLSNAVIDKLHADLGPAFLLHHEIRTGEERNRTAFLPDLPIAPLSVLSLLGAMTRGDLFSPPTPVKLVDTHLAVTPSRFLQENFGCYSQSISPWPIAADLRGYLEAVLFVPEEVQSNRHLAPRADEEIVSSEAELVRRIANHTSLRGLAQMAASAAPRIAIRNSPWSRTVNVVIGDSFADRLLFWNAIHHSPIWRDGNVVTLKLSREDIDDQDRLNAIVRIIQNRIHLPVASNANHAHIALRSASIPVHELETLVTHFRVHEKFNAYTSQHLQSVDAVVPSAKALVRAGHNLEAGLPFGASDWHEMVLSENRFRPHPIEPRHLRDTPQLSRGAKRGCWQIDIDITRPVNHSIFQNVRHHWRIPSRLPFVEAFAARYSLSGRGSICMPRATVDGLLSLTCGIDGTLPEVNSPEDAAAFRRALTGGRNSWPFAWNRRRAVHGTVAAIQPSDKGRYLRAMLRMTGEIHRAKEIFLSGFWKERFETLGATPQITPERVSSVKQRLKKKLRGGKIDTEEEWERLAKSVIVEARAERQPARYLKFDRLLEQFEVRRTEYWAANEQGAPDEDWKRGGLHDLAESVKYLCRQEILHQGYEWRCQQCFNCNWVGIGDLGKTLVCEVCGQTESPPVVGPWHFKMNGFILEGIREHGLLPLIWCLSKLADNARDSFFYLDPHEIFFTAEAADQDRPDAELDLLVVSDGIIRMCETKASGRDIDVGKVVTLAKKLQPHLVTVAVMEPESHALSAKVAELQKELSYSDIKAELVTLKPGDIDRSPMLPMGTTFRMLIM
jgi:hypothetical protein